MDTKYEVSFQERVTDSYFTCRHGHGTIKEAVACLYQSTIAPYHDRTIFALSDGEYRVLNPSEWARVRMAARFFIV
jgi:hypothetical protein